MKNLIPLSGYLSERHAWQLLKEMALRIDTEPLPQSLSPQAIAWEQNHFVLDPTSAATCLPPEGTEAGSAGLVWQLGATVFSLVMGCEVFHGQGGAAQQATSPVPYLRKSLPELSGLVREMLAHDPSRRPTALAIASTAQENLGRLGQQPRRRAPRKATPQETTTHDFWPYPFE